MPKQVAAAEFPLGWITSPSVGRGVLFVLLAGLPVVFSTGTLENFEYPKAMWLRLATLCFLAPAVVMAAARFARLRVLTFSEVRGHVYRWCKDDLVSVGVLGWLLSAFVSTLLSVNPRISWWGEHTSYAGLTTILAFGLVYFTARNLATCIATMERLLAGCLLAGLIASMVAILQFAGVDPVGWTFTSNAGVFLRPFGTLGHPNHLGALLAMLFPIVVYGATWAKGPSLQRGGMILLGVVFLTGMLVAMSRAAWLGWAAGMAVWLAVVLGRNGVGQASSQSYAKRIAWSALGAIAVVLLLRWWNPHEIFSGLEDRVANLNSGWTRLIVWERTLAIWLDHPIFGIGPDTFQLVFAPERTAAFWDQEWDTTPTHAHNEVLQILVTQGLVGAAALIVFLVGLAQASLRALRHDDAQARRLAVALVSAATVFLGLSLFSFTAIGYGPVFMVLVAFLSRLGSSPNLATNPRTPTNVVATLEPPMRWTRVAAIGIAGVGVFFLVIVPWRAHIACARGDALLAHDIRAALTHLEHAVALDSSWDIYWIKLARANQMIATTTTNTERRRTSLLRARTIWDFLVERNPHHGAHHDNRGLCLAMLCQNGLAKSHDAFASFDGAIQRDPNNPLYYADAADAALRLGEHQRARRYAEAGLKRNARYGPLFGQIGYLKLHAGEDAEACEHLQQSLGLRWEDSQQPGKDAAMANLIVAYHRTRNYRQLEPLAVQFLLKHPEAAEIRALLVDAQGQPRR